MNLYRSFGNLMEAWVTEGSSDSEWLENTEEDSPTPSSDVGTNLRSESVDSGVETASSDMSFPATSCSILTDNAEIDTFTPETPASTSQSPVQSSPPPSSSSCSFDRAQESGLQQRVAQALQRADSEHLKDNPEPLTVDEVLRRRPRASFLPKRHTSEIVRGQRSEIFGLRGTVNPSVPMKYMCRRPVSMNCGKLYGQTRLENLGEEAGDGLSPGLSYLEQVCQMLEEVARQQLHNQALQMEANAPREHEDMKALDGCHSDSKAAEDDFSPCRRLDKTESAEQTSSEPQRRKDYARHFRQRSASDTTLAALHLRRVNADCRGQHLSTDDLLDRIDEDHEKQEFKKEETNKSNRTWKFKIGSLGRNSTAVRELKGEQTQSSEKNSARRRLSQLFRRNRRKTLPV